MSPSITIVRVSAKGSKKSRRRIGDDQHVALINGRPAANTRTIDAEAIFKALIIQHGDRIRDVLIKAGQVGKRKSIWRASFSLASSKTSCERHGTSPDV